MADRLERALSIVLVTATVAIAVALGKREFFDRPVDSAIPVEPLQYIAEWKTLLNYGFMEGNPTAKVKIIEFGDLQCPFCRIFQHRLESARGRFGSDVAVVFIHYPIEIHPFAKAAARSAECARAYGRFAEFVNLVYAKQESLGTKSWNSFANEIGISDTGAFRRCVSDTASVARVVRGQELGQRFGVHGTPTVIVNGWKFGSPPNDSLLGETISALLAGKKPKTT